MIISEIEISSIESLMLAVNFAYIKFKSRVWWRGHGKSEWDLLPYVFRDNPGPLYEYNLFHSFRRNAPARHLNTPQIDEAFEWLFLMQHYRLPTRLLDWTESPLIALFFAVQNEEFDNQNACIYALSPSQLNLDQVQNEGPLIANSHTPALQYIVKVYNQNSVDFDGVIATSPIQIDNRMMVQLSEFTIHGSGKSLLDLPNNNNYLFKFLIPATYKSKIRIELDTLGLRESILFPDLEHLSNELKRKRFQKTIMTELELITEIESLRHDGSIKFESST